MSKRKRFVITSIALSLGFIGIQLVDSSFKFVAISLLGLLTLILFYWSLREGLGKDMTLMALVLPVLFTLGVGLFWFLIPASIFARIPIVILYGLGIYALCLTSNIYTVAAIRSIALLRAARGVGFVLTLLTSFLVFDTIFSLKASLIVTGLLVFATSFPLFLQGYWVIPLIKEFSWDLVSQSAISSFMLAEIALSLHFWPVTVVVGSLFLTVTLYVLLGLGQAKLESRLFRQTVREYMLVGLLVFVGMLIATRWGG